MQPTIKERILANIKIDKNGCWLWQRHVGSNGYGQIWVTTGFQKGSNLGVHRISYEQFKGEVPEGMQVDHLCKVRHCVNPKHLEAVTPKENIHRSDAYYRKQMARTHCPQGHEYTEDNMYTYPSRHGGIIRNCKICMKARSKARYYKKLEAVS